MLTHESRQLPSWLIFDVGQDMLRILPFLVVLALGVHANPIVLRAPSSIPGKPVFESVMVGESVTVTVSEAAASAVGHFRFRDAPGVPEPPVQYFQTVQLPVPIPVGLKTVEEVATAVRPLLLVRGVEYRPEKSIRYPVGPSLSDGLKLALFSFKVDRTRREKEIEVEIRYEQPVISIGGKEVVYYIPFLPHFQRFAEQMNLREESFQVRFEATGDTSLQLLTPGSLEVKSIVVPAKHKDVIAVERKKPNKAPEPTPGSVTSRADARLAPAPVVAHL